MKEFETKWIGWPGVDVYDAVGKKALSIALAEKVRKDFEKSHIYILFFCQHIYTYVLISHSVCVCLRLELTKKIG